MTFKVKGVTPQNRYREVYITAVNRQQAIQKFQVEYPELAICQVKPLHRGTNPEAIKKATVEKR